MKQELSLDSYVLKQITDEAALLSWATANHPQIDCLILQRNLNTDHLLAQLETHKALLPIILVDESSASALSAKPKAAAGDLFVPQALRSVITYLKPEQLGNLEDCIHQAIDQFLALSLGDRNSNSPPAIEDSLGVLTTKQQTLARKLKERLGYLGVYYKRNAQNFFRNMTLAERQELLEKLSTDYRGIVLSYFSKDNTLNQKIDDYVNVAFFADVPVSEIVEIHMDLMDEFSKQLQLEGRSEEILLDYRLTLIDIIAHLCEMYRRSIPREL
ncbi:MAG: circadian clock protein KaiA [Leptolyngbyaceae cyanobacterium SM1_1_3]|nr:circadian clock protein KaiA [Leptolyngbyaceae cyanobacterium SM1_1_3]NJN03051.1 circadian clock protein KaiA [Leptolyngbyaceae cyanobacterium RM1_1_2]